MPREEVTIDLTRRRWDLLGGITNGLLAFHDRVICTDVDELLVYIGDKPNLIAHLQSRSDDCHAFAPIGLDLMPIEAEGIPADAPILARYPDAWVNARYTKPCIASRALLYVRGGHGLIGGKFLIDPDVLLFHLHYVTPDYAERMSARKEIVKEARAHNADKNAPSDVPKRLWVNWAQPKMVLEKVMGAFEGATLVDVSENFSICAAALNKAIQHQGHKMVVDPGLMKKKQLRIKVPQHIQDRI